MTNIKNILLTLVAGLLFGGLVGYYVKGKFVLAGQTEAVVEQRKEDVQAVSGMQQEEHALQFDIRGGHTRINTIRSEIKNEPITQSPAGQGQGISHCDGALLGINTVRLLNAARDESIGLTSTGGNGEGAATSEAEAGRDGQ